MPKSVEFSVIVWQFISDSLTLLSSFYILGPRLYERGSVSFVIMLLIQVREFDVIRVALVILHLNLCILRIFKKRNVKLSFWKSLMLKSPTTTTLLFKFRYFLVYLNKTHSSWLWHIIIVLSSGMHTPQHSKFSTTAIPVY